MGRHCRHLGAGAPARADSGPLHLPPAEPGQRRLQNHGHGGRPDRPPRVGRIHRGAAHRRRPLQHTGRVTGVVGPRARSRARRAVAYQLCPQLQLRPAHRGHRRLPHGHRAVVVAQTHHHRAQDARPGRPAGPGYGTRGRPGTDVGIRLGARHDAGRTGRRRRGAHLQLAHDGHLSVRPAGGDGRRRAGRLPLDSVGGPRRSHHRGRAEPRRRLCELRRIHTRVQRRRAVRPALHRVGLLGTRTWTPGRLGGRGRPAARLSGVAPAVAPGRALDLLVHRDLRLHPLRGGQLLVGSGHPGPRALGGLPLLHHHHRYRRDREPGPSGVCHRRRA